MLRTPIELAADGKVGRAVLCAPRRNNTHNPGAQRTARETGSLELPEQSGLCPPPGPGLLVAPLMNRPNQSQDELVWEYFGRRKAGFFVEVGANHPTEGSQTWLLEQNGWRGILVEPQERLFQQLTQHRPRCQVFRAACSTPDKTGFAALHIPADSLNGFASLERNVDDFGIRYERTERVELATLDALLVRAGSPKVDFVSIDTEGTELDVLRGFDVPRHRPGLILIEDKGQSLCKHRHLRARGYKLVKRTELNNWYVPQDTGFTMTTPAERLKLWRKVFLGLPFRKLRHWRHTRRRGPG
jgi:FkbM family methyltransferase